MAESVATGEQNPLNPFKVEVTKNSKGYKWAVRVYGEDLEEVKTQTENLETWCKEKYGAE